MTRSVLDIAQAAVDIIGVEPISAMVNETDPGSRTMLALLNQSGNIFTRDRNAWGGSWSALTREHVMRTEIGEASYDLPADWIDIVPRTVWDQTSGISAGAASLQQWQRIQAGQNIWAIDGLTWRLTRSPDLRILIDPVPGSVDTISMLYISRNWLLDTNRANPHDRIRADTDIPVLDDMLVQMDIIWRFKQSRGLPFASELAEFEMERDRRLAEEAGSAVIPIGFDSPGRRFNFPEGNWPGPES